MCSWPSSASVLLCCSLAVMPSVMERSGAGVLSRSRAKNVTNGNSQPHSEEESSEDEHAHGRPRTSALNLQGPHVPHGTKPASLDQSGAAVVTSRQCFQLCARTHTHTQPPLVHSSRSSSSASTSPLHPPTRFLSTLISLSTPTEDTCRSV